MQPPVPANLCPACRQPTEPGDFRHTDSGWICQSCAFQLELAKTRQRTLGGELLNSASNDSFVLGFVIGFLCGCCGLAWVYYVSRGPETKRGVWYGNLVGFLVGLVLEMMRRSRGGAPYFPIRRPAP